MIVSLFLFVGIMLLSIVLTYTIVSIMSSDKINSEAAMDAVIQTNISLIVTTLVEAASDTISIVTTKFFEYCSLIPDLFFRFGRYGALLLFAIYFHESYVYFLSSGDNLFRCFISPLFQDAFFSIFQVLRLLYGGAAPVANYAVMVSKQLSTGTYSVAIKCDISAIFDTLTMTIDLLISMFKSVGSWTGGTQIAMNNNLVVNMWNVTQPLVNSQRIIAHQERVLDCICDGFKDIWDIAFVLFKTDDLPKALNHLFNVPISLAQVFLQLLPPYVAYPTFTKTAYHIAASLYYTGAYLDHVLINIVEKTLQLFLPEFTLVGIPHEFIFTAVGRLGGVAINFAHVLLRFVLHLLIPIKSYLTNPDYMLQVLSMTKVFAELELTLYVLSNSIHWILLMVEKMQRAGRIAAKGGKFSLSGIPDYVALDCAVPSIAPSQKVPCTLYSGGMVVIGTVHWVYNFIMELLWKSVFFQQQQVIRVLQKYDGMWIDRKAPYTCEYRRDNMTWDITRGECHCDRPTQMLPLKVRPHAPFGLIEYDPFCGQPTLQASVLYPLEKTVDHILYGSFANVITDIAETVVLLGTETIRVLLRSILAAGDSFDNRFRNVPINCGYGDNNNIVGQPYYANCSKFKKHTRYQDDYCTEENKEGCTCNPALPLAHDSLCKCIFYYPDVQFEYAQFAYENPLLEKWYKPSTQHHWCNSYHFEYWFLVFDKLAYYIDNAIKLFSPGGDNFCEGLDYKVTETAILQYTKGEYDADSEFWNHVRKVNGQQIQYSDRGCKVYGSTNFVCGLSITLRVLVKGIVSEVRSIVITISDFLIGQDLLKFKLDIAERLCDLQRVFGAFASMIGSIFDKAVSKQTQKGISQFVFQMLNVITIILEFFNNVLIWISDLMASKSTGKSPETATFELILSELNILIYWLRGLFEAFGNFMNGIKRGAGAFFFTLDSILKIFQGILSEAVLELFGLIAKVIAGIVELFSAGGIIDGFFKDIGELFKKFFDMITKMLSTVWQLILGTGILDPIIKPFNSLKAAIKSVCSGIEGTIKSIPGLGGVSLGCSSLRATGVKDFFHSHPDTPLKIATVIDWDGTSRCDQIVHRYKEYTWNQLRPLEQIEIVECLELRAITENIRNSTDLPIPVDILYNWQRKWIMGAETIQSAVIYGRHAFGSMTTKEMLREMKEKNLDTNLYLPMFSTILNGMRRIVTMKNIDYMIHETFKNIPDIEKNKTATSHMYNLYKIGGKMYHHSKDELSKLHGQMQHTYYTVHTQDFDMPIQKHFEILRRDILGVPEILKSNTQPISSNSNRVARNTVIHISHILGAAGVKSDTTPCSEREDAKVCMNCLILDNFFDVLLGQGENMANYYDYTYSKVTVPGFVSYFEQQEKESKAWREDMGKIIDESYSEYAPAPSPQTDTPPAAAPGQTLYNYTLKNNGRVMHGKHRLYSANETLTCIQQSQKDWEYFVNNLEVSLTGITFKDRYKRDLFSVISTWMRTTDTSCVPYVTYGLPYIIAFPFTEACPADIVWCTRTTTEERLDKMVEALWLLLYIVVGVWAFEKFTLIPTFTTVGAWLTSTFAPLFLLYMVYGFVVTCVPNFPVCLVDDIYAFFYDKIFPNCFCTYYPGLSQNCDPAQCFICSKQTTFLTCDQTVPLSSYDGLGYFWSPIFWFRKEFPDAFLYLYTTIPYSWALKYSDGIKDIAIRLQDGVEITQEELDCLGLRYMDVILIVLAFYLGSLFLSAAVPILIKMFINGTKLMIHIFNTIYSFGVALEVQTTAGIKNSYQD